MRLPNQFRPTRAASSSERSHLLPLKGALDISSNCLGKPPVGHEQSAAPIFTTQSQKRDVAAAARRFTLGQQPRGVHLHLRAASTKEEHVELALDARSRRSSYESLDF